jgi:hypothetical protein
MTFSTLVYEREHGCKPRGRGSWAFCPWAKHNAHDYLLHTIFSPGGMTLTQAKKWARLHASDSRSPLAAAVGQTIVVMP